MGKRLGSSLGVDWHMPLKGGGFAKRRFATTTVATAELLTCSPRLKPGDSCFFNGCLLALGARRSHSISTG